MPVEEGITPRRPVRIYISSTDKDVALRDELLAHLVALRHAGEVEIHLDGPARAVWKDASADIVDAADIVLLLVSAAFLSSEYDDALVERALRRSEAGGPLVLPVILRPCAWEHTALSRLQALPKGGLPVTTWPNTDEAFAEISKSLLNVIRLVERQAPAAGRPARRGIEFVVEVGDILTFDADVIVLKHAQAFYGADEKVMRALEVVGISAEKLTPAVGEYVYLETYDGVRAPHALFVGTPVLFEFDYADIRSFSARALQVLAREHPAARHVAMTMHGVGYGMDETEAAYAQFAGIWDSVSAREVPPSLERISLIDLHAPRVERLRGLFDSAFRQVAYATRDKDAPWAYRLDARRGSERAVMNVLGAAGAPGAAAAPAIEEAGLRERETPYVFVAMPFKEEMEDVFYYGIQKSAHAAGYLCERIDQEAFTGDILERLKSRIERSALVIADLTGDNPNVFLEVGYAWGKRRPTVLVVKESKHPLRFDVQGQRCIKYKSIRSLEQNLTKMLNDLKADGSI